MVLRRMLAGFTALCFGMVLHSSAHSQSAFSYRVTQTLPLPGEGNWDYFTFDAARARLFIARVGGVDVFDARRPDLKLVGQIPGAPGNLVNRAVLVPRREFGFTSNGTGASTTIFGLEDLAVYGSFPLGEATDAAVYDDVTGHAVFFSGIGQEALVYDLAEQEIVARIPLGSSPEFAVDDHHGSIYVNLPDTGEVAKISATQRKIVQRFAVSPACHTNASIDIDLDDQLLFVGCFSGVMDVINIRTGAVVATFPTGPVNDAVVYDPGVGVVFASSVDGKITAVRVYSATRQALLGVAQTDPGVRTLTVDPSTHRVFTATADTGTPFPGIAVPPVIPGTFRVLTLSR